MALKILLAPHRYLQGPHILSQVGEQLQNIGIRNPLILASRSGRKAVEPALSDGMKSCGITYAFIEFSGECTFTEIERVKQACLAGRHDAIINCGGGKVIDTGRAAAAGHARNVTKVPPADLPGFGADVKCVNIPTVAATDGATSLSALVYSDEGPIEATMKFPHNPAMVVVDTAVIAGAPIRFLVAGIGDALTTYFEGDMTYRTGSPATGARAPSTRTGRALARLCFDLIMEFGVQGKTEAEAGIPGPGLEALVEATVLLSGLGFENTGLSAAHSVGNAFHHIRGYFEKPPLHGELTGFGTLVQLMLEEREPTFLGKIFGFCRSVGLPTTFQELGLRDVTDEALTKVADAASRDRLIHSMAGANKEGDGEGRFYDHLAIVSAMKAADAFGRLLALSYSTSAA